MKCVLKDSLQRNCLHLLLIYNNQFATISFTGKWCSKQPKPFSSHQRKRANLQTIIAFLPISDSLYLTTKQPDSLKYLGCVFLGEFQNEFVISDHVDSSLNQKKLNPKKDHLPWQWHFLMLLVVKKSRGKNNKLILVAKTRRRSNLSYVWIYKMYIFQFEPKCL